MSSVLQQVRKGLDTLPDPAVELTWNQLLTGYYEKTGQLALQLQSFKKYIALQDSLTNRQQELAQADIGR
ncbi:MAG: hypothetical protein JWP69_2364 [Flaviaesturariibacter sp.]|nr:hypothetical protein [Flaviaesturariibacter sp.]